MSDTEEITDCALWYDRDRQSGYTLCDDEEEAMGHAYYLQEWGEGAVVGVQFADGRLVKLNEWDAYRVYKARRQAEEDRAYIPRPARPTRKIIHPFDDGLVTVDVDEPEWLGR